MKENFKCEGKNCVHEWPLKEDDHPYLCHKCGFDSEAHKYNFKALDDWKMSQKPYTEEKNNNVIKRTFSNSVNESELVWHRDKSDRVVKLLSETDWMIQFDNELPRKMSINEAITIPKNVYHRVIKGSGDLMVEITETDDVNEEEMIDEMKCWDGYHKEGTKISDKTGKRVNNCVKTKKSKKSLDESIINEKMVLSNYDDYSKIVAQAYIDAPDFDQSVVPSYKSLMDSTKKLFKQLQSKLKVEFVDYDPYESRTQMNDELKKTGVLKITKLFNEHPLYTKEENLMFRTVHDYYTHIISNQDFGLRGELRAYNTHAKLVPPSALPALFTEVVGQVSYAIVHGDFTKQKICKLEGFDYRNIGKIDNMDIIKKELQIDKKESVKESVWNINPIMLLKK